MKTLLAALGLAALVAFPAHADLACGSLLMPAGQLKQVSRGVTAHHAGLDLVAPHGSPLRAAAGGTVTMATSYFAYGLTVDIDHGNGVLTRYAHLAAFAPGIRPGAQVAPGQLLGQIGRTGRATTAHLHFEVRVNGRPVDPKPYLSLADCTPRTPTVRFDEARARPATPGPLFADAVAARPTGFQGRLDSRVQGPAPSRAEGRPGGLLD